MSSSEEKRHEGGSSAILMPEGSEEYGRDEKVCSEVEAKNEKRETLGKRRTLESRERERG